MAWTGKKCSVHFSKPNDPSFLKKFKERVGYKEDKGLSAKFQNMPAATEEDLQDGEDELPQIVQLNPDDLSQVDLKKLASDKESKSDENDGLTDDGRILFRKPTGEKHSLGGKCEMNISRKKAKMEEGSCRPNKINEASASDDVSIKKREKKSRVVSKTLLSFDEDEEDE